MTFIVRHHQMPKIVLKDVIPMHHAKHLHLFRNTIIIKTPHQLVVKRQNNMMIVGELSNQNLSVEQKIVVTQQIQARRC